MYLILSSASSDPSTAGFLHFFLFLCLDTQVFMREARREKSWSSGSRAGCAGAKEATQLQRDLVMRCHEEPAKPMGLGLSEFTLVF